MKLKKAIALRLSNLMRAQNITQYELSKRSTLEQSTIFHILNEDTKQVKIQTIFKIVISLNISLKEFFDDPLFDNTNIDIW